MVTETECIEALRAAARQLGESPTKTEYEELDIQPSSTTILRVVGGWNEAKALAGLETYTRSDGGREGGMEVQPKPDGVALPDDYVWEDLTAQQRWYYKRREHRIEVKDERRARLQRWFYEFKWDEVDCTRCGEGRPRALDFHHTGEKEHAVSKMIADGYSRQRVLEEVDRCIPLCVNCHRKEHYDGPETEHLPSWSDRPQEVQEPSKRECRAERRRWVAAYKRDSDGCRRCDVAHPACLDFHHETDKEMEISHMISFGRSLCEIHAEIGKCVVLCANCHREADIPPPPDPGKTDSV